MDELMERLETKAGVGPDAARKSIAAILGYLDRNAPAQRMEELYAAVPGARELVGAGGGGGLFGGGIAGLLGVYSQLKSAGLTSEQMQSAGVELLAFTREKVGDEAINDVIASVPALRQLL
jgi:hypothetical protein